MKTTIIFLFMAVLASCGLKVSENKISWHQGDSQESYLKLQSEIKDLNWKTKSEIDFAGYKIFHKSQIIDGRLVEGANLKEAVQIQSSQPYLIKAQYKEKGILPIFEDHSDLQELVENFKIKNPEYRILKLQSIEPALVQGNTQFISLWRAIFESKTDAQEVFFYKNLDIYSKKIVSTRFDASAKVYPKGSKRSQLTQVLLSELSENARLASNRTVVESEVPDSTLNLKEPLFYGPEDLHFDQVQAYFIIDSSLKWFETKFGYKPFRKIEAMVHLSYPEKTNAAFYYSGKIRLGTGDGIDYQNIAQDPSIVIHESAHSVIEAVARLPSEGEGGSLNEGFADFFAAVQLQNPYMGEVSYLKAPYKRSLLMRIKLEDRTGSLYGDSLILSGLLWDLYQNLGEEKSLKIASRLLVEMDPNSDFAELKNLLPIVVTDVLEPADLNKAKKILEDRGF